MDLLPDATRCPQCRALLTGGGGCAACGLSLAGPAAQRLWEVDTALLRLDAERRPLLQERSGLLAALRTGGAAPPAAPVGAVAAPSVTSPAVLAPAPSGVAREWTPQRVQGVLLGVGALLLAVALVVFTAVTYDRLGAGGRAAVLLALTGAVAAAVPLALRRGLASTAEALAAVALVLGALDAYGLRRLGVGDGLEPLSFAAVSAAVLSVVAGTAAAVVPVRLLRAAAVGLAALPLPLAVAAAEPSLPVAGALLSGQVLALVAVAGALRTYRGLAGTVAVAAVGSAALALPVDLLAAFDRAEDARPGALALLLLAAAPAAAAGFAGRLRPLLAATPVVLVAVAAHAATRGPLTDEQGPLVPAAVAVLAVQAAALLPRALRPGPVLGALAVAAAAVAAVADTAAAGVAGPLLWVLEPWTLADGAGAREALTPFDGWTGTVVTTVVLGAAAVAAAGAGLALHRERLGTAVAAALAAAAVVLLPLGLALPHAGGIALLLGLAAAALLVPRPSRLDLPLLGAGGGVLVLAAGWSLADRTTTLVALPLAALALLAVRSPRWPAVAVATTAAGVLASGELAAAGAAAGFAADQVGGLLVLATAALAAVPLRRRSCEAAALLVGAAAVPCAAGDPGWLSWVLAGLAVVCLATALRPDRRVVAAAGGLLLAASSWVRLAAAEVTDPEPYVLPLAVVVLVLGHLRRRAVPSTSSTAAYGGGLSVLLLPSLLAALDGGPLWRPLALLVVSTGVLLAGVRERLRAPLLLGGAVAVLDALVLVAPYAEALPRWLLLGGLGALLVGLGATYEQRRQDLARLRAGYDALA